MTLPPLNGLLALEAVIRHGNVRLAAEELGISQPAVSQRLRSLENHFGRSLIARTPTGFDALSDVERYAVRLQHAISSIRAASEEFRVQSLLVENRLSIALLSTFAQRWLIPRLVGFQRRYPEIDVHLMTTSDPSDLLREDADISIRCGAGSWPGYQARFLIANRIFPVASPGYLAAHPIVTPRDLADVVLIRVDAPPREADWDLWLDAQGLKGFKPRSWQSYANSTHAIEAATAGLGVTITHTPFVADSIAAGRLVMVFDQEEPDPDGDYYLVCRESAAKVKRVSRFADWLFQVEGR